MVKSGSFKVSQGSLGGRIGSGIGKGLGEQLPKEIAQQRLASGLQQFAKNAGNLSPLEAFAQASSIPGVTPQMIQALPELLKQQQARQSYLDTQRAYQPNEQQLPVPQEMRTGGIGVQGREPRHFPMQNQEEIVQPGERGQPQIVETNPLRPEAVPTIPWTPQRRDQEIGRILEDRPTATIQEAVQIAADNEKRYLEAPKAVQEQDNYFRQQQDLADNSFDKKLETKLEKNKEGIFGDITGENLINLKRNMYKDLRTDPNATIEDVTDYWTTKALDLSKTKKQLAELQNRNFLAKIMKGKESLDKLKSYQKIFAETGNQEEFYNTLRTNFDLSPQGAAYVAYPASKPVSSYISSIKKANTISADKIPAQSRKYATDIENFINRDDSILAIARELKQKDRFFDERSFFNQLRDDQDTLGLTPRQKREIAQGESSVIPTWGDLLLLPIFKESE